MNRRHTPSEPDRSSFSRRIFLAGSGLAGSGLIGMAGAALPATALQPVGKDEAHPSATVSVTDFGAVGDGVSDDSAPLQAALDWAGRNPGTALHFPARMFGLSTPLLVPEDIELSGEVPGSGNRPLCGLRALPGFHSNLVQRYRAGGGLRSLAVGALLVCKEWAANAEFAGRLHIRDLFFDVDSLTDDRGAPIHGLLLSNQQLDLHNVWVRHPTGFGVWINTQRPEGDFVKPIVDNVLRRVWVRGAGIGGATFETDHGLHRYGGFLIGALPGARDNADRGEPAIATDGILDYCTVAGGPEKGLCCRGDAIHITQAAGWRLSACHINGAGRHGIKLRKAYLTEITGNYLDGWGVDADAHEGDLGGIWCTSLISLEREAEGGLIVSANRVRARGVRATAGNRFTAIGISAGTTATPRGIVSANFISRRRDADHAFAAFHFARGGSGELEALVSGNVVTGAERLFLRPWDEAVVRPRFAANDFQYAAEPPAAGWHPTGLRIENTAPQPGGWDGWVSVRAGEPGTWRGIGRIES